MTEVVQPRREALMEVFILPAQDGVDPVLAMDVTFASLRAARFAKWNLAASVVAGPAASSIDVDDYADLAVREVPSQDSMLAYGTVARCPYFMVITAGQALPWRCPVSRLFQSGRSVLYGRFKGREADERQRYVMLSGIAAPMGFVPVAGPMIYSSKLAERALVLGRSMYGEQWHSLTGEMGREQILYAALNDDSLHTEHALVEDDKSPFSKMELEAGDVDKERIYARLSGL